MPKAGDRKSPLVEDQSETLALLADPATHGFPPGAPIVRIETHGAVVFLAGGDAYKLKRAVRFPFMDLSTLEKRRVACEAEIAVNRPNAPDIYLGVMPVTRGQDGLALGGVGQPVEWVVHMRRFDEAATLDRIAEKDGLPPALLCALAAEIAASHARAPVRADADIAGSLGRYVEQNDGAFQSFPDIFAREEAADLTRRSRAALAGCRDLLACRVAAGLARRCHGDLHLRNIALLEGRPVLFDGIEFDEDIATCDLLYDLAFLLMDLWERGFRQEANSVLNRWLLLAGDDQIAGLRALPLFLSIRAALRAKIAAAETQIGDPARATGHAEEARRYFRFARDFLEDRPPRLVAVGGLSGTGKSTLAAALAPLLGDPPGAVHRRSDVERKRMAGVPETERLPAESYTPASSAEVYRRLSEQAGAVLDAGWSVIVDAVFADPAERDAIRAVAEARGASFSGLWLTAPTDVLAARVAARTGDASDADASVVHKQAAYDIGALDWTRLDVSGTAADVLQAASKVVGVPQPEEPARPLE